MGWSFSCKSPTPIKQNARVVHLNGYVEDFEDPITVSQITGNPPIHFVCTQAQLLSPGFKPLKPETQLEPARIYFLLPYSTLQPNVSPEELVSLARKLTVMAKTRPSKPRSTQRGPRGSSPTQGSPASSPSRFSDPCNLTVEPEKGASPMKSTYKSTSWRPILATIRERSFNGRSESELQEKAIVDPGIDIYFMSSHGG